MNTLITQSSYCIERSTTTGEASVLTACVLRINPILFVFILIFIQNYFCLIYYPSLCISIYLAVTCCATLQVWYYINSHDSQYFTTYIYTYILNGCRTLLFNLNLFIITSFSWLTHRMQFFSYHHNTLKFFVIIKVFTQRLYLKHVFFRCHFLIFLLRSKYKIFLASTWLLHIKAKNVSIDNVYFLNRGRCDSDAGSRQFSSLLSKTRFVFYGYIAELLSLHAAPVVLSCHLLE